MGERYTLQSCNLIIEVNPRLHITLIGMNAGGYRTNGGCGFSIDIPSAVLHFSLSDEWQSIDYRKRPFSKEEDNRLHAVVDNEKRSQNFKNSFKLQIFGDMPTHYGFGSGTAIRLACLEALYLLNKAKPDPQRLIMVSGRGGTSGIGINTYYDGGFVIDLGRKTDAPKHLPSCLSEDRTVLPLLMQRLDMPEWEIGLCLPENITYKSKSDEKDFFQRTCPIASEEVYKTLYEVIYGLYAAVKETDFETFCAALRTIQQCAWKSAERAEYGDNIFDLEKLLYDAGAKAVGMSSLGPSLFFLADNVSDVITKVKSSQTAYHVYKTKPSNSGRVIKHG